jgi:ABC-2 type transport system ATP-binding protein
MIEVANLSKRYGDLTAIRDVSFSAADGQILGFLGPNGAGKTTTMRIITGFMPATSGTVRVDGFDVFEQSTEVRRRIGYLPENPPLYNDMSVAAYLRFVAKLKGLTRGADIAQAVDHVLETCGLTAVRERLLGHLSKGFRQRVGLAQALIHDPPVLVLDEPTIGLDPRQIIEIRGLIKTLGGKRTIVLSTHILPEVSQVCDKVVIINDGRIVVEDQLTNLTRGRSLEEVFIATIGREARTAPRSMRNVLTIAGKEIRSYFASPVAYVLLAVYLALGGYFFFALLTAFNQTLQIYSMMRNPRCWRAST